MEKIKDKGLTEEQVLLSRKENGDNVITPSEKISLWRLYLEKFDDPMIKILLFAVVLSLIIAFIHNDFTEVIGVSLAVVLATSIGFWFEWDASRKFDILNALGDEAMVKVRRDDKIIEIFKRDVVVGDIVL
ncbi:MAG: cation-transporting P-type ATPase, partial [Rikenellaceae bacterium]